VTTSIFQQRSLLRLLVSRDLKVRYADSTLGYLWTIIDPLAMALIYWFVFSYIFHRRVAGESPYVLFLILGLLPWQWIASSVADASRAMSGEARIVRSASLPREVWVVRIVLSKMAEFIFATPVIIGFAIAFHKAPSSHAWLVPLAILLQFFFIMSLLLFLAPLTVLIDDLQRLVRIVMRMYMYLSPVIFGMSRVPDHLRSIMEFNPMVGILQLYRASIYPQEFVGWMAVGKSAGVTAVLFICGRVVFRRLQGTVLKEI
jgi:ABC-2 type transport system permease protein